MQKSDIQQVPDFAHYLVKNVCFFLGNKIKEKHKHQTKLLPRASSIIQICCLLEGVFLYYGA